MSLTSFARYPLLFGPSPVHPLERLTAHLGGRAALGQTGGLQLRHRVRREQDAQAGVPGRGRTGPGLRHAGLDRRGAVQPHPAGRRGGGPGRAAVCAGAGELGRLAGRGLRQGRQHPAQPARRRRRTAGALGVRHRVQGELGAGAAGRRGVRREAVRDPGRRIRPPARRSRLRRLGLRGGGAGTRAGRLLRHHRGLLGHRFHPGRDDRRLRRARRRGRPASAGTRRGRVGEAGRDPGPGRADRPLDRRGDRARARPARTTRSSSTSATTPGSTASPTRPRWTPCGWPPGTRA